MDRGAQQATVTESQRVEHDQSDCKGTHTPCMSLVCTQTPLSVSLSSPRIARNGNMVGYGIPWGSEKGELMEPGSGSLPAGGGSSSSSGRRWGISLGVQDSVSLPLTLH